jgi:tetratricopeptide (TPR) repeat protein
MRAEHFSRYVTRARLPLVAAMWIVAGMGPAALAQSPQPQVPPDQAPPMVGPPDTPRGGIEMGPNGAQAPQGTPDKKDEGAGGQTLEEHTKLLDELYARLATAPDEATATQITSAIEQLWQHSGSATADLLVARASAAIESDRRDLAMKLLNAAVELQPDFAEAWNRRAYLFYLEDDYKRALGDIRRVLALEPNHYKALEGLANILRQLGEKKGALSALDSLLKVHPNASGAKQARDDLKLQVEGQGI